MALAWGFRLDDNLILMFGYSFLSRLPNSALNLGQLSKVMNSGQGLHYATGAAM
jgi:hypothetical protein